MYSTHTSSTHLQDPIVRYVATEYTKHHRLPVPVTGAQVLYDYYYQILLPIQYLEEPSCPFTHLPIYQHLLIYLTMCMHTSRSSTHLSPLSPLSPLSSQIVLRWALQKGFSPIPRSSSIRNLSDNLHTLMLPPIPPSLLAMIDGLQFLVASSVSKAVAV